MADDLSAPEVSRAIVIAPLAPDSIADGDRSLLWPVTFLQDTPPCQRSARSRYRQVVRRILWRSSELWVSRSSMWGRLSRICVRQTRPAEPSSSLRSRTAKPRGS